MKKIKIVQLFVIFCLMSFLGDCSSRVGDFTAISTRNSNIKNWKRANERVEGKSCTNWVLIFPFGGWDMKDTIEDAIDAYNDKINGRTRTFFSSKSEDTNRAKLASNEFNAESILDAKFTRSWWTLLLISRSCLSVEGNPSDSWYNTQERTDQIKPIN
jgi:hypothetical protein